MKGDLEVTDKSTGARVSSDVQMQTIGSGGSGLLSEIGAVTLRLKGKVLLVRAEVDKATDIAALDINSDLLQVVVEGTWAQTLANGLRLEPSVEGGIRYDGGDGRTGTGVVLGAGLRHLNAAIGLTVESNIHALVGRDDYDEWGIQGLVRLDAGADGQGLSLSLSPGYGDTANGIQNIWRQGLPRAGNDS